MYLSYSVICKLDKKIRREYDTALEVFPQLVRKETKIMDFLRTVDYDVPKAAMRLVMYWKLRKAMFKERWLLPMTQTGTGALSMDEIETLRSGYAVCFNRSGKGIMVLHDHSRLPHFDGALHAKNIMYYCTTLTDEATQTQGISIVFVIRSGDRPQEDFKREAWEMLRTALPVRFKQLLVVQAYEEGREYLLNFLAYQTTRVLQVKTQQHTEHLMGDSLRNTLSLLEARGIEKQHLPPCLGGDYTYNKFADWVRMRVSMEDIMSPAPLKNNRLTPKLLCGGSNSPSPTSTSQAPSSTDSTETAITKPSSKKKATRKRKKKLLEPPVPNDDEAKKLNALYSRRAYHKRKLEMLGLEEQVKCLETENESLRKKATRFESFLQKALQLVQSHEGGQQESNADLQPLPYGNNCIFPANHMNIGITLN
uniref:BZIP domain-containing protein n=1 Tax=Amphora coffeiformis TaxID=265554 RepID=A0A7S3L9W3_9STRA